MSAAYDTLLRDAAEAAGLQVAWRDAHGEDRIVSVETQRALLSALGLHCETETGCRDTLRALQEEDDSPACPALIIVQPGQPVRLRHQGSLHYRLELEDGKRIMGTGRDLGAGGVAIDPIRRPGYHRLLMGKVECMIAVIPAAVPGVAERVQRWAGAVEGRRQAAASPQVRGKAGTAESASRAWLLGTQLYSLHRGSHTRGVPAGWEQGGDYGLLQTLAEAAGAQGAAGLAMSPVHAMFSADTGRYSPYAPSSRLFLNVMYADPMRVFGSGAAGLVMSSGGSPGASQSRVMDWPALQAQRLAQLRRLHAQLRLAPQDRRSAACEAFAKQGGENLRRHACYEALHAHFAGELGSGHGWQDWPAAFHDPAGEAVRRFAADHAEAVGFHIFLQWLAAESLRGAKEAAARAMPLGLIADLAVGTDPRGSHAWSHQDEILKHVSVGAPPDLFQAAGQNWGLSAFSPRALRRSGYAGFIETVRAALAYAGGLRMDHFMGLERLWLVPEGAAAIEGAYLRYPREELMDLLKLEAWRHDAVVVGENLGTVSEGFDEALQRRGFLGMNVLWFEQEDGPDGPRFRSPDAWPPQTLAMITTHDLPTIKGWWRARDIDWRERQGQQSAEEANAGRQRREQEKRALWRALQEAGLVPADGGLPESAPTEALFSLLAATPSALLSIGLEDLLGQEEQPNLPGDTPEEGHERHPNWLGLLPLAVDEIFRDADVLALLDTVSDSRELS